jgi:hypothetical protein
MKFKDNHSKIVKKFIDLIGYEKMKSLSISSIDELLIFLDELILK